MKTDPINPSHYRSHPSGVEAIEILEHLPYNIASGDEVSLAVWT